eukprot:scaffold16950_cov70-Skeletonema_marinoi.AAC.2
MVLSDGRSKICVLSELTRLIFITKNPTSDPRASASRRPPMHATSMLILVIPNCTSYHRY